MEVTNFCDSRKDLRSETDYNIANFWSIRNDDLVNKIISYIDPELYNAYQNDLKQKILIKSLPDQDPYFELNIKPKIFKDIFYFGKIDKNYIGYRALENYDINSKYFLDIFKYVYLINKEKLLLFEEIEPNKIYIGTRTKVFIYYSPQLIEHDNWSVLIKTDYNTLHLFKNENINNISKISLRDATPQICLFVKNDFIFE